MQADRRGFLGEIDVEIGSLIGDKEQGAEGYTDRFGWPISHRSQYGIGKANNLAAQDQTEDGAWRRLFHDVDPLEGIAALQNRLVSTRLMPRVDLPQVRLAPDMVVWWL